MVTAVEIERKFLVPRLPEYLDESRADQIRQGYLAIGPGGDEVRIRDRGSEHFLTVKSGTGRTRTETEIELAAGQAESLWPAVGDRQLAKRRYLLEWQGSRIELDVYSGVHSGLIVAEVEFASEREADDFSPPPWFGREVTDDPRYKNQTLALEGLPGS